MKQLISILILFVFLSCSTTKKVEQPCCKSSKSSMIITEENGSYFVTLEKGKNELTTKDCIELYLQYLAMYLNEFEENKAVQTTEIK